MAEVPSSVKGSLQPWSSVGRRCTYRTDTEEEALVWKDQTNVGLEYEGRRRDEMGLGVFVYIKPYVRMVSRNPE